MSQVQQLQHKNPDVEALVDLFLSPSFIPLEGQYDLPPPPGARSLRTQTNKASRSRDIEIPHCAKEFCAAGPSPKAANQTRVIYESAIGLDEVGLPPQAANQPRVIYGGYEVADGISEDLRENQIKQCGRILAKMGDEFYKSYNKDSATKPTSALPWNTLSGKLMSFFHKAVSKINSDLDELQREQMWQDFKAILASSISDAGVADPYHHLGALLLTLRGVADASSGIKGIIRSFFLRYIRERQLDAEMQRLGGLDGLIRQ